MPNDGDANGRVEDDYRQPRNDWKPNDIKVEKFDPSQSDFEDWVHLFERAVRVSTSSTNDAVLNNLYLDWLPLKFSWDALHTYKQAKSRTWPELKTELCELFIDPQEEYKWRAKVTTIKWDGKESIHKLASRVIRNVNKYDKRLPQDVRDEEYFSRFRSAFRKRIRHMIDMGCPRGSQTIENAKDVVMRNEIVQADREDDETGEAQAQGNVSFANGNFQSDRPRGKLQPDRATGIETALAGINTHLENIEIGMRKQDDRMKKMDDRIRDLEKRADAHGGRRSDRDGHRGRSDRRDSSHDRRDSTRSRDGRDSSNDRGNSSSTYPKKSYGQASGGYRKKDKGRGDNRGNSYAKKQGSGQNKRDNGQGGRDRDNRRKDDYRAIQTEDENSEEPDGSEDGEDAESGNE